MEWTRQHTNRAAQTWEWSWLLACQLGQDDLDLLCKRLEKYPESQSIPYKQDQTVISKG